MKVGIGADHRGIEIKKELKSYLESLGHEAVDCGSFSTESCDYPDIAAEVASRVSRGELDRGILICMSGIGMAIAANKVKGIRAALCHNENSAKLSRQHNNANVLVLATAEIGDRMNSVVAAWFEAEFEGGRHERRVAKIAEIEQAQGVS